MSVRSSVFAVVGLAVAFTAAPALAEDDDSPAVLVYAQGGGINSTTHFDFNSDAKFKTGWNVGGGLGLQLNRYVAIRGNFTFVRDRALDPDLEMIGFNNSMYDRYIYSGDLELGYPLVGGLRPYIVAGGGGMTFSDRTDRSVPNFTRGFGKAGVGLAYDIPNSNLGIFVQGTGFLYSLNSFGPSKTVFDTTWVGGVRLRFPI